MREQEGPQKLIFISHKSNDNELARSIRTELKSQMDDVDFFLSEEIEKGDDWRANVEDKLKETSCFVLVYTSSDYDWSWCLYEAIIFIELVRRPDPTNRRFYCIHYSGSSPPDPLKKFQATEATDADLREWLANLYQATGQTRAFASLEATAAKTAEFLDKSMPKPRRETTDALRPSIRVYPSWLKGDKQTPNWGQLASIPANLPLRESAVEVDAVSASQLGFNRKPDRMNVVDFLGRLDTENSEADRPWVHQFLESLQATLQGRMTDQNIVYFRSNTGGVLRPIIESITRSGDGLDCTCRVVFVDAFSAPPVVNPSPLQLLANGLRLAVRARLELLDRYKGKLAQEFLRIRHSRDPAEELGKLHPIGGRVLEILRTIVIEAEMQGTHPGGAPPLLFEGDDQNRYETLRETFTSMLSKLNEVAFDEDRQPEGTYVETEKQLEVLAKLTADYIAIAAPRFLSILTARGGH